MDEIVGPYYGGDEEEVIYPYDYEDIYFDYFQDEDYSVKEVWLYYNNKCFMDMSSGTEGAPDNRDDTPSSYN